MGVKVEILYNPYEVIPPLKSVTRGESFMLQTGEDEFKIIASTEMIFQELAGFVKRSSEVFSNPNIREDVRGIARSINNRFSDIIWSQENFDLASQKLIQGRVKHEYRHLEQALTFYRNGHGQYIDLLQIDRMHQAYRLGDKERLLDPKSVSLVDRYTEYLQTIMEIDAILSEFQEDHLQDGIPNINTIEWRLGTLMKYLTEPNIMICVDNHHIKAMIVLLTGRIDLAEEEIYDGKDYQELLDNVVKASKTALIHPERFLSQLKREFEPQMEYLIKDAFTFFMEAHEVFMEDALSKKIIPSWR